MATFRVNIWRSWQKNTPSLKCLTFSHEDKGADVALLSIEVDALGQSLMTVSVPGGQLSIKLQLLGQHNVQNALAAVSVAVALNIPTAVISAGFDAVKPVAGRMCPVGNVGGVDVIDDSYNANPASIKAAIDVLAFLGDGALALGDMAELGEYTAVMHEEVGRYAGLKGIKTLYLTGQYAADYAKGFEETSGASAMICSSHKAVAESVLVNEQGNRILIKGSRSAKMEKIIEAMDTMTANEVKR